MPDLLITPVITFNPGLLRLQKQRTDMPDLLSTLVITFNPGLLRLQKQLARVLESLLF